MSAGTLTSGTMQAVNHQAENPAAALRPVLETDDEGTTTWKVDGILHRDDGPAVEYVDGYREWCWHGHLHREDGPAVEDADGTKAWYLHGQRHREDGPATEWADGDKEWFLRDQRHREDGPAVENADGTKEWWLNDQQYTKLQWLHEVLSDRPLSTRQRELLFALSENWEGTPDSLYETVRALDGGLSS